MPHSDPTRYDYLAIVSEWSSQAVNGGLVGNAYPILNLETGTEVTDPEADFPNPGAVFLTNRGGMNTWDYVILRLRQNLQYKNERDRECYYITRIQPEVLQLPDQLESVAIVLDHTTFDLNFNNRQIQNPAHNVTPYFFVRKVDTYFGPMVRERSQLSSSTDDMQRIDWRPSCNDGIVFEFTKAELAAQGIRLIEYRHPAPYRNRILEVPIEMALGKVRHARSNKAHDTLPLPALMDWFIQRSDSTKVSPEILTSIRNSFKSEDTEIPPLMLGSRLQKIDREIKSHAAFAEQRDRFAREYLQSDAGKQRLQELIDQTVKKKASEIQREVDSRQQALAAKRDELAKQFEAANTQQKRQLAEMEKERQNLQATISELKQAAAELQGAIAQDAGTLARKMREQIPLLAALSGGRNEIPVSVEPQGTLCVDFVPIKPTKELQPIGDEKKFVDELHADLARQGLAFARDFIANVYTCLKAEALNLIIGPPGYGKSMLVAELARSLGHGDALLSITVRRSWAEDRHLLGFFDNFNHRYDPGQTNLVARMLQADADWRTAGHGGIYIVLLDEFNLAAPEYYFSQLLQRLPSEEPLREVDLYDPSGIVGPRLFPGKVTLQPNLRFWGTINYDETTERLSPRTLDRTGMIFLGDADIRPLSGEDGQSCRGGSAKDLFEKFLRKPTECPEDRWSTVSEVADILRSSDAGLGPRIELSPRVQKGIRRYLANSVGVLDPHVAADFVVQQRILPVIRGRGDGFLARVRRLAELLVKQSLDRSARHVEDVLRRSELQFGDVDFLSY
jgi:hypothetical protein